MANQWFKFWGGEYLGDPKIFGLNDGERSCWLTLLCLASISSEPGKVFFLTEKQLMLMSGLDFEDLGHWKKVEGVLDQFKEFNMIEIRENFIEILNYKKRQEGSLTEAERKFLQRKNQKENEHVRTMSGQGGGQVSGENRIEENRIDKNIYIDLFEKFWNEYPRKVAKKKALASYEKIENLEVTHEKIMAALNAYKQSEQWQEKHGQFIPHPATWLNQERWNDEPPRKAEKKAFYHGQPMQKFNGKWKVLEKGQWNWYGGKESEITYA